MTDVAKALEMATDAVGSADIDDDWGDIARAAVLAFLRAMPDGRRIGVPARLVGFMDVWNYPSTMVKAIEAEVGE